ncbi:MAG: hypothetical protein JST92_11330 [Deltaproteobacteria bacterium]|nr:hypothetical protein [Deltaproteobacteria bacterium]
MLPGTVRTSALRVFVAACLLATTAHAGLWDDDEEEERERAGRPSSTGAGLEGHGSVDPDDPAARRRAMLERQEGVVPRSWYARELQLARKERDRIGTPAPGAWTFQTALQAAHVPGNVWLNVGPSRSDFSENGVTYHDVDSGRARKILVHPSNPDIIYMATSGGGVWKTVDGAAHWAPISDTIGNTSIGSLAMDPMNPDILWLGLGDPFDVSATGIFQSTDGGATWVGPALPAFTSGTSSLATASIRDIKVDPANSARVFVASDVGLFISDPNSAGQNGLPLFKQATLPGFASTVLLETWSIAWLGGNVWLVSGRDTATAGVAGVWRSTDGGVTWTDVRSAINATSTKASGLGRCTIASAPSTTADPASARAYMVCANNDDSSSATADTYRTDDGGVTFRALGVNGAHRPTNPNDDQNDLNVMHDQAWYNQAIGVDPQDPNTLFIGGNLAVIRSRDAGATWSVVSDWLPKGINVNLPYVHADMHAIGASVSNGKTRFYFGSDGGLFGSDDVHTAAPGQATVVSTTNVGLVSHLLYNLACAHDSWPSGLQDWMVGGLQDNGTRLRATASTSGPSTFNQILGGDGIGVGWSVAASASGPSDLYASVAGGYYYSSDAGDTFVRFADGITQGAKPFFVGYTQDVASPGGRSFLTFTQSTGAADGTVYLSTAGNAWSIINGTITPFGGAAGSTFVNAAGNPISPRGLSAHPKVSGIYGMYASGANVFVTKNGRSNAVTWSGTRLLAQNPGLGRTLAVRSTSSLAFDPSDTTGNHFLVGTVAVSLFDTTTGNEVSTPIPDDWGHLYETKDGGQSWTSVLGGTASTSTRLPNTPVNVVQYDPNDAHTIYVGTNFGLYRSTDDGKNFSRFGLGLPLVKVSDLCVRTGKIVIATYGRGFWQINTGVGGSTGGVRGNGDSDLNLRIDGFDLLDAAAALGTSNKDDTYRPIDDLTGTVNQIDDADLAALLNKFGGTP